MPVNGLETCKSGTCGDAPCLSWWGVFFCVRFRTVYGFVQCTVSYIIISLKGFPGGARPVNLSSDFSNDQLTYNRQFIN